MSDGGRSHGARGGARLFLVHGDFGDGFEAWGQACADIGPRYRTVTVDRPGVGAALGLHDRYSIAGEAAAMLEIADELTLDTFHLAGHSYGALIALEMAASNPDRIRSLHLIEPPLLTVLPADPRVQEMALAVNAIQRAHATVGDDATTEAFFAMIGAGHVPERLRGSPEWSRLCQHATRFSRNESVASYPPSVLTRLSGALPVGLYSGGRSHPALRAVTRELVHRLLGARLTDVPSAGHAVQMAGEAFVVPLLTLVAETDAGWENHPSATATDCARK